MFGISSDIQLVKKALKGKAAAWDKLIGRHHGPIYNFSLRMTGNRDDALDLTQEVFLATYKNLSSYSQTSPFGSWLFAIASRRAMDFFRRRKPEAGLIDEDLLETDDVDNPHRNLAEKESNRTIQQLLRQLNPDQRLVVELKFFQEMTFDEISQHLGVSPNTLKARLYSALKKMKNLTEVIHAL